jgi:hypothetical protein
MKTKIENRMYDFLDERIKDELDGGVLLGTCQIFNFLYDEEYDLLEMFKNKYKDYSKRRLKKAYLNVSNTIIGDTTCYDEWLNEE